MKQVFQVNGVQCTGNPDAVNGAFLVDPNAHCGDRPIGHTADDEGASLLGILQHTVRGCRLSRMFPVFNEWSKPTTNNDDPSAKRGSEFGIAHIQRTKPIVLADIVPEVVKVFAIYLGLYIISYFLASSFISSLGEISRVGWYLAVLVLVWPACALFGMLSFGRIYNNKNPEKHRKQALIIAGLMGISVGLTTGLYLGAFFHIVALWWIPLAAIGATLFAVLAFPKYSIWIGLGTSILVLLAFFMMTDWHLLSGEWIEVKKYTKYGEKHVPMRDDVIVTFMAFIWLAIAAWGPIICIAGKVSEIWPHIEAGVVDRKAAPYISAVFAGSFGFLVSALAEKAEERVRS